MKIIKNNLNSEITKNVLKYGIYFTTLCVILLTIISGYIYITEEKVNINQKLWIANNINDIKKIKEKENDISYISVNGKVIVGNKQQNYFVINLKKDNDKIEIGYNIIFLLKFLNTLLLYLSIILFSFLCMAIVLYYKTKNLIKPIHELYNFTNNYDINKLQQINYKSKNVTTDFDKIRKSYNKLLEKIHSINNKNINDLRTDSLTNLGNRLFMEEKIIEKINNDEEFSIVFVDLDNFKIINDIYGHEQGDEVLKIVSNLFLRNQSKESAFRLGGDEFVIILNTINKKEVGKKCKYLLDEFKKQKIEKEGYDIVIEASLGISLCKKSNKKLIKTKSKKLLSLLLKRADIALYESKGRGKNIFTFYQKKMYDKIKKEQVLNDNVKKAIKNNEFILYYQPQFNMKTGLYNNAEALLRWEKDNKLIYPNEFINFLENSYLMIEVGYIVIQKAFEMMKAIKTKKLLNIKRISINLSIKQFDDNKLLKKIKELMNEYNVSPHWFEFEITERLLSETKHLKILEELKNMGFTISVDDFGTGYSSLSRILNLPINKIKIDKSFINNLDENPVTDLIIELASIMEKDIIAEGVETKEQSIKLYEKKCFNQQGYYHAKPMDENKFLEFCKNKNEEYIHLKDKQLKG